MGVKILKFLGAILILEMLGHYIPYGPLLCTGIIYYAIWRMVNE